MQALAHKDMQRLEWRCARLHDLAASLDEAKAAILRADASGLSRHAAEQQEICRQLLANSPLPDADRKSLSLGGPPGIDFRGRELLIQVHQLELGVWQSNLVYAALLRRARRTFEILERAVASSRPTYTPPACLQNRVLLDGTGHV